MGLLVSSLRDLTKFLNVKAAFPSRPWIASEESLLGCPRLQLPNPRRCQVSQSTPPTSPMLGKGLSGGVKGCNDIGSEPQ
ncbi:hypothetical protein VTK26DRAFT_7449 [Humicola hyalothermophila]